MTLRLDWCPRRLAEHACRHWHYARSWPGGVRHCVGAWEDGRYIGAVVFGTGAIYRIGDPYGLEQSQVCELVRVALRDHTTPTSRIVSIALRFVKRQDPALRLIVSYADPAQGHHGGIYQALGWVYTGQSNAQGMRWIRVRGKTEHPKTLHGRWGTRSVEWLKTHVDPAACFVDVPAKHKYLWPLDDAMRRQIAPLARPYPRRQRLESEAPGSQPGTEGAAMRPAGSIPVQGLLFYDAEAVA
jgi:hypothetical protein